MQPVQHIHGNKDRETVRAVPCTEPIAELPRLPTIADLVPLTEIMSRNIKCARRDLPALRVAELMVLDHIGCLPVVEEPGRPIGMITKLDLVERFVGIDDDNAGGLGTETAEHLMMPMAISLEEHATVAHAAALMASEDIHHVPIVNATGHLVGIVSTMDIVRWLARNDGFSPPAAT